MINIQLQSQTLLGTVEKYQNLVISSEQTTLRKLITDHIEARYLVLAPKIEQINTRTDYEKTLNTEKAQNRFSELEIQLEEIFELFRKNRFLVLVDDCQINDLDENFQLSTHSTIQFIKLIPLIGG